MEKPTGSRFLVLKKTQNNKCIREREREGVLSGPSPISSTDSSLLVARIS